MRERRRGRGRRRPRSGPGWTRRGRRGRTRRWRQRAAGASAAGCRESSTKARGTAETARSAAPPRHRQLFASAAAARGRTAAGRAASTSSRRGCRAAASVRVRMSRCSSSLTETRLIYTTLVSIQMGHAASCCCTWLARNLGQNLPPSGKTSRPIRRSTAELPRADNASLSLSPSLSLSRFNYLRAKFFLTVDPF